VGDKGLASGDREGGGMTPTTLDPAPLSLVRAPGELRLLHRRALAASVAVVDRALTYAADDDGVTGLVRTATLDNLWTAELLGRWGLPAPDPGSAGAYHRSVELVDQAACRARALEVVVPLAGGSRVGSGADLLAERIVALDRFSRALASAAAVHRTVDGELDRFVARLAA
jgi:hypothetical protein